MRIGLKSPFGPNIKQGLSSTDYQHFKVVLFQMVFDISKPSVSPY